MKIALLTEKYTPDIGGLAISSERLAKLLSSVGHEVRVFAPGLSLPASEKRSLLSSGVSVTRFGAHKRVDDTLVDWFELIVEEHAREPFDLLHAYFLTSAGFTATYAGKYLNLPSVVSIRGNDIERAAFDPSKFSHAMYALQNAGAVTTNATELARKAGAFTEREIHLIPNGVDADHFKPVKRNEELAEASGINRTVILRERSDLIIPPLHGETLRYAQGDTAPVIGFVGELRRKKGLETLLLAYAQVNKTRPTTLLIVGTIRPGEDKESFEEFTLSDPNLQIIVTGYISPGDLPNYYALMDVFVHPSLRDGMPNAVLEAMACEKAVIATPVGGVKDILEDGKNGVIVNVNDASMLAQEITDLLDDPKKRGLLGKNARELIAAKFTPKQELEANLDVYRKLGLKL
jgi:glycosyltransferase involved in cell wall biosynthesis